jgi:hypothetical protein
MLQEFRSVGKMYKKIAGKRYRLPRKVKKRFKTNMCKRYGFKKLKLSYKRLNQDIDGNKTKELETCSARLPQR